MPDPVIWGPLSKLVDDPTTIEEQVDADILTHNIDPSAHGQVDEAISDHRVDTDLDHPVESVNNEKILKMARAYKYIVDAGGDGDFTTIQPAIEAANADDGGRIFVKAGTYVQTDDIELYTNIQLIGEDDNTTIIDFDGLAKRIDAVGTAETHLNNILVRGFTIKNCADVGFAALWLYYVDDSEIFRNKFTNNVPGNGGDVNDVKINVCSRVLTHYNYMYDSHFGLNSFQPFQCKFLHNHIVDPATTGIALGAGQGNIVAYNFIDTPGTRGIDVAAGDDFRLLHNDVWNWGNLGIAIGGAGASNHGLILGNTLYENVAEQVDTDGIQIGNQNNGEMKIIGNYVVAFHGDGLDVIKCNVGLVTGNTFRGYDDYGVRLRADGDNFEVLCNNLGGNLGGHIDGGAGSEFVHNQG